MAPDPARPRCGIALAAVSLLLVLLVACGGGAEASAGEVDHKVVTGVRDDVTHTILIYRLDDEGMPTIFVKDPDFGSRVSTEGPRLIVEDALALDFEGRYEDVYYHIHIRLDSAAGPGTQPYRTTRDIFNGMQVGTRVRFEAEDGDTPSITKWLDSR